MRIEADQNGFLTWDRIGVRTKIFCPFNKRMQCNQDCPRFQIKDGNTVVFCCISNGNVEYKDTQVFNIKK